MMLVTGARAWAGAAGILVALVTAGCGTTTAHRAAPHISLAGRSRTLTPCAAARAPGQRRAAAPAGPTARPAAAPGGGPASGLAVGPQPAGPPAVTSRPAVRVPAPAVTSRPAVRVPAPAARPWPGVRVTTAAVTRLGYVRLGVSGLRGAGHRWCRARWAGRCPPWLLRLLRRSARGGRRPLFAIPYACIPLLRASH